MSLLCYLKKGSGSVLPSPGGPLSRHMPSSSIVSANKEVKSVLDAPKAWFTIYCTRCGATGSHYFFNGLCRVAPLE